MSTQTQPTQIKITQKAEMYYNSARRKLETSFKNSIEKLDYTLKMAQTIPSLSWYIFEVDNTPTFNFFNNLENINYIDDIHGIVKKWIEDTNAILEEPSINRVTRDIPFYISQFFTDVLIMMIRSCCIGFYNRITYHKQYIAFYEKTIEPCFALQEGIRRQMNKARNQHISSQLSDLIMIFSFSCVNNLFLEGDEAKHKRQYKNSLRIVKNAERLEGVKLFFKKIFGKI
jgi:hypothetical protein